MKRKLLICGATGFIGRNMAEYFADRDDFDVYGTHLESPPLEHPKIKMLKTDLTDKEDVARAVKGMDIVIQAAATTSGAKDIINKPYYHVTDNSVMNSLIFRAAHEYQVSQVIFFSCTVMYQSSDTPIKETDFDANQEIFPSYFGVGWTKVYIEKMCEFYSRIGNTKYTVIRHSNIYGPYDKFELEKSHVFAATLTKVMTAKNGDKIIVWGAGEEARDLLYIDDLVNFVEMAIDKQKKQFGLYNIGYGSPISIKELVQKIIDHSGKAIRIEYDLSKPNIPTKVCLDTGRANMDFGWAPKVSLDDGIRKTMQWYIDNIKKHD
ncbi:MAG: NAD-dependent epimerase/dehydratase family protein [Candidatus Omnitrophica bacterium]|nr:NAD-dependent epimerase/dehydratase family protein [Candidatus Omnitrophota bacterium]